jgi:hypothetical protein
MDDLDLQLFILEAQEECDDYDKASQAEIDLRPVWWNVHFGLIEATLEQREKAQVIFLEFMRFNEYPDLEIEERFKKFEQFKLFNGRI